MIPDALKEALVAHVGEVRGVDAVGGGCISNATRLSGKKGTFFLKYGAGDVAETFEAEAAGLAALEHAARGSGLRVPHVIAVRRAEARAPGFLLMEWIEPGRAQGAYWERFGRALAKLHRAQAPCRGPAGPYGFTQDDFIGRLPQQNAWTERWPDFFREQRLLPQLERARRDGLFRGGWDRLAARLLDRLDALLPERPHPSTLHGDLWSGNQLPDTEGRACLVDPAVYVGHREADLAMTELFGGFGSGFYEAYREEWPLEPGYEERREVYNLYHLLNHLNHFGGSYASGVERVLERFGG